MRNHIRRGFGRALLVAVLVMAPAAAAWADACGELRSFRGVVVAAGGGSLSVERGGRSTSFPKAADVRVVDDGGTGVSSWGGLEPGLRVTVCWAFDDQPRVARKVLVTGR